MELFLEALILLGDLISFLAILAVVSLFFKNYFGNKMKDYIWRKVMHLIAFSSIIPLTLFQDNYLVSLITIGMLIIILFFGLLIIEHFSWFGDLLVEKYPHEILISLTLFYISVGLSIYLGWGIYKLYFLPLIAVLTSGLGDAFGALIGKSYGNHIIEGRFVEGKKSLEGSVSVLVISFLVSFISLMIIGVYPWYFNLLIGLTLGICSSLVELFTKYNLDNIVLILVNTGILMMFVVVLG